MKRKIDMEEIKQEFIAFYYHKIAKSEDKRLLPIVLKYNQTRRSKPINVDQACAWILNSMGQL